LKLERWKSAMLKVRKLGDFVSPKILKAFLGWEALNRDSMSKLEAKVWLEIWKPWNSTM